MYVLDFFNIQVTVTDAVLMALTILKHIGQDFIGWFSVGIWLIF